MSAYTMVLTGSPVFYFIHPKETYNQSLVLIPFLPAFDISLYQLGASVLSVGGEVVCSLVVIMISQENPIR